MFFCAIYYEKLEWNNLFMIQVCVATPCATLHVLKGSTKWNSVSANQFGLNLQGSSSYGKSLRRNAI